VRGHGGLGFAGGRRPSLLQERDSPDETAASGEKVYRKEVEMNWRFLAGSRREKREAQIEHGC